MLLKYYFVFVLTVLLLSPLSALAARAVPGVVPSVVPLFPTPVGVEPNVRGNVQYQGESVFSDEAETDGLGRLEAEGGSTAAGASAPDAAVPVDAADNGWAWWLLGGVLAAGVLGGAYWYRKHKQRV